jgi:hypothetical protein
VSEPFAGDLTARTAVTLVLRLVVNRERNLVYGEALDVTGQSCGRFLRWNELVPIVERCLESRPELAPPGDDA